RQPTGGSLRARARPDPRHLPDEPPTNVGVADAKSSQQRGDPVRSKVRRLVGASVAATVLVSVTAACSSDSSGPATGSTDGGSDPIHVVTTVAPITSIAAAVIGDDARITGIVPEGTN